MLPRPHLGNERSSNLSGIYVTPASAKILVIPQKAIIVDDAHLVKYALFENRLNGPR